MLLVQHALGEERQQRSSHARLLCVCSRVPGKERSPVAGAPGGPGCPAGPWGPEGPIGPMEPSSPFNPWNTNTTERKVGRLKDLFLDKGVLCNLLFLDPSINLILFICHFSSGGV